MVSKVMCASLHLLACQASGWHAGVLCVAWFAGEDVRVSLCCVCAGFVGSMCNCIAV
jgi:hypothetical protein